MPRQHYKVETYRARESLGYLVKRTLAEMQDMLEPAFAEQGLTLMQWVVLMYLRDGIATNPKHICAEFRHDSGALTRMIDQLEERGCIERRRSTEDRRSVELHLLPAGRKLVQSLAPMVVERLNTTLSDFSRDEVQELTRLLGKLIAGAQRAQQAEVAP